MPCIPSALRASASVPAVDEVANADATKSGLADVFLLLAAAFAPPPAGLTTRDWCELLAADLEDAGLAVGIDTTVVRTALREAASGPESAEPWLVEYSRLFLVPPVAATLNTGIYLEGGLAGTSAQMMSQCYATAGFAKRETFRDLPDHVAIQLEFVGALLERSALIDNDAFAMAREFADGFVTHWVQPLQAACARAVNRCPAAEVYAGLAGLTAGAVDRLLASATA